MSYFDSWVAGVKISVKPPSRLASCKGANGPRETERAGAAPGRRAVANFECEQMNVECTNGDGAAAAPRLLPSILFSLIVELETQLGWLFLAERKEGRKASAAITDSITK